MRLLRFTTSCYSAKVAKALDLKGIGYRSEEIPYFDRRELVRLTGGVTAPVLVTADRVLTESARITRYLDDEHEPSLREPPDTATAMVFEQWADQVLEDAVFRFAAPRLGQVLARANDGREDVAAHYRFAKERKYGAGCLEAWERDSASLGARVTELLAPLAQGLERAPYVLGSRASLADAAVWGNLTPLELGRPGWLHETHPRLFGWFLRVGDVCSDTNGWTREVTQRSRAASNAAATA